MRHLCPARSICFLKLLLSCLLFSITANCQEQQAVVEKTSVRVSFGYRSAQTVSYQVRFKGTSPGLKVAIPVGSKLEANDQIGAVSLFSVGAGDVDELTTEITWPKPAAPLRTLASHQYSYSPDKDAMWGYLLSNGLPGQVARLKDDPWNKPDAPLLTILLSEDGTRGFTIGVEQLLRHKAMWLPEHDAFVTLTSNPLNFKQHLASLKGIRTLNKVKQEPDASLGQFKQLWEDFGNPLEWNKPWETTWMGSKGHLVVTAPAHGSLYKFTVDRWANVRPDFASPHKFAQSFVWQGSQWKSQRIVNGLPVVNTTFENKGQQCQIEQFAAQLTSGKPAQRGEIAGVMLTKLTLSGKSGPVNIGFSLTGEKKNTSLQVKRMGTQWAIAETGSGNIWLMVETGPDVSLEVTATTPGENNTTVTFSCVGVLPAGQTHEIVLKLPSPAVPATDMERLAQLNFDTARQATIAYWENWLSQGAHFQVPEQAVNNLFRANLWHALILPRHRTGEQGEERIDLPYANTAYGQVNADWPINQGVYVDYMIYGLRGHWQVAEEEFMAMFQSQQQPDGRIAGYANWGVYSPGHLYAIAQNYLLSQDKTFFQRLLPQSIKTLDWCLSQVAKASIGKDATGLIRAPLNDLTHEEREWGFTQAYYVAGLELFSRALSRYGHARAEEVKLIAEKMKEDVERTFAKSSVQAPVIQLADGTWNHFVPSDAMTSRRLLDEWYPTDVDCGPLHLSRLAAIDPKGWLTTAMLHDHEDNLFLKNQGAANEPIYVQQASAYLLRDEPEAAIRSFYSLMACGFSHHQLSPLEHRWAWGQYYGPPSSDGAWFELYRKMLIHEWDHNTLIVGQAIPRPWLENGKRIEVKQAPTYFGTLSFSMDSNTSGNQISATVDLSGNEKPEVILVRFRHPQKKKIRSVSVNGQPWKDFDRIKEWVRLPKLDSEKQVIIVTY
ncbi:hypothetical protein Q0590_12145 [Rhodocytophaga aerolata]|uniref:Alpha-L-rhamnosidase six-hairpin glycosidase domain-containing protein n=1 Tax=Rhodocytophaga aerolata TaxID=455078 RepID=A0ABT8R8N9_9BACT|nr:hypothetical protein [Rhodocytophaga aerolata]MDO1447010.1 hypothetical protein [Rhodocytophaga aerolata]